MTNKARPVPVDDINEGDAFLVNSFTPVDVVGAPFAVVVRNGSLSAVIRYPNCANGWVSSNGNGENVSESLGSILGYNG
jgi:hypothetical protein